MMAVKMALRSIGANKMRAALTMLGIIRSPASAAACLRCGYPTTRVSR